MITRDPPFYCDVSCDKRSSGEERIEADSFREVVDIIKANGWTVTREHGEWVHICPDHGEIR